MKLGNYNISKILAENRWTWHLVFWLLYATSRIVVYYYTVLYYDHKFLEFMLIMEVSFVFLVYSTFWLYRKLWNTKKIGLYFLCSIVLWIVYLFLKIQFQKFYLKSVPTIANANWIDIFIDLISAHFITFLILTALKYLKDNFIEQYYEKERKAYQIESELKNLKAQISPHFLFNTMNNFYGLAVENSKKLPELMVRLSDLLRYSLYETKQEKVALSDEIRYINNYIELEKIRLEDSLEVDLIITIDEIENYQIAPLLLIIFIENSFKHARNIQDEPIFILINIVVSMEGVLTLKIKNNYDSNSLNNNIKEKGIGLENVKKRLDVIYPNSKHSLIINKEERFYNVELTLNLN